MKNPLWHPFVGSSVRRFVGLALTVSSSLLIEAFTSTSWAQAKPPSRYDVFDIGDIPPQAGWHTFSYTAFAINENNSVAGYVDMRITGSGVHHQHAIFWTPNAEHGFSAFTLYDMTDLAALSTTLCPNGTCDGVGYDINDADVLVGSQKTDVDSFFRGFLWNLPTNDDAGGLQTFAIDSLLATPTDGGTQIHGINDASPPTFVGEATDEGPSGPFGCPTMDVAFRATFNGSPGTLTRFDSLNVGSVALDANEGVSARASGQARAPCGELGGCSSTDDAQRWPFGGTLEPLDEGSFVNTISRAINNAAQACGDSGEITEDSCPPVALFWDGDGTLTVIGDPAIVPQLFSNAKTRGWGISPSSGQLVNVVGEELESDRALLWHRDASSDWSAYDLSARIIPGYPLDVLNVAHDVNSQGWIVGRGLDCLGRVRGFVLRPAVCPADLDGDCVIAASDLAVLLGWWGAPGINGAGAYADLDQDGLVGASDLAIVLGSWGPCPEGCATCLNPCAPAAMSSAAAAATPDGGWAGSTEATLALGLAALGFDSVEEFNGWAATAPPEAVASAVEALAQVLLSATQGGNES